MLENIEYMSKGKNMSFICSHVDSFTGTNSDTIGFRLVNSYAKCKRVPRIETSTIPNIIYDFNDFINITS